MLILLASAAQPRLFEPVDGTVNKAEFIVPNPETKERLYIRYCSIADMGVELELIAGDTLLWREHVQRLGVAHSKYDHRVSVRIEDGKILVTSRGAKTIFESRELKTGKLISRTVTDNSSN